MKLVNKKTAKYTRHTLSYIFIAIMLFCILYPVIFTIVFSLQPGDSAFLSSFSLEGATLENYFTLIFTNETMFKGWYIRTLMVGFLAVFLQLLTVSLCAYAFSRFRFYGRKNTLTFFLLVQMIPNVVALPTFYIIAVTLNMQNIFFLVLIYVGGAIPMQTLLLKSYFDNIPRDLDRAAKIDGASYWYIYKNIIIPLAKPMLVVMALWAFMQPFSDYMVPMFLFAGSPEKYTLAAGLNTFLSNPQAKQQTLFAAGSVLASIPVIILFYYIQKDLVGGLLKGATKG